MTQEQAWTLLKEYNQDEFHLEHADIVGKQCAILQRNLDMVMRKISGKS